MRLLMPTVTLAHLQNAGFQLVDGGGERIQRWMGELGGEFKCGAWDSVTEKWYRIGGNEEDWQRMRYFVTVGVIFEALIAPLPVAIMSDVTKNALRLLYTRAAPDFPL